MTTTPRVTTSIHHRLFITGRADQAWVLQWQTTAMPAPAFWYYSTYAEAQLAESLLHDPRRPAAGEEGER